MGTTNAKATNHLISLGDEVFNREMEIREDSTEPGKILPIVLTTTNLRTIGIVTNICRGIDLIDGSEIFLGYQIHRAMPNCLVLFLRHEDFLLWAVFRLLIVQ
jgi:hypothetical protein